LDKKNYKCKFVEFIKRLKWKKIPIQDTSTYHENLVGFEPRMSSKIIICCHFRRLKRNTYKILNGKKFIYNEIFIKNINPITKKIEDI
jgi:hypothetical protein